MSYAVYSSYEVSLRGRLLLPPPMIGLGFLVRVHGMSPEVNPNKDHDKTTYCTVGLVQSSHSYLRLFLLAAVQLTAQ
jgi:hypothetical protein